jgi:uncharacterized protein YjiS (DUF1127 family)
MEMSKVLVSPFELSTGRANALSGWVGRLADGLQRVWQVRQAAERLADFTDAELADIGIARSDIARVVRRGR